MGPAAVRKLMCRVWSGEFGEHRTILTPGSSAQNLFQKIADELCKDAYGVDPADAKVEVFPRGIVLEEDDDGNLVDMTWEPTFTIDPEVDADGARAELEGIMRRMMSKSRQSTSQNMAMKR